MCAATNPYPSLSAELVEELRADARSLPPLTDEQLDAIADTLAAVELRRASQQR